MVNIAFSQGGDVVTYDRYAFFQWDSGQKLQITGLTLEPTVEIHFANSGYPAIVMLGETASGTTTVNVPDIVLQRYGDMNVYIYRTNGTLTYTFKAVTFSVRKREKPVDYVEQVQPGIVAQLVNKLNRVIDTGIASYVPDTAAVNQMIQNYVQANLIANNLTTTAAGLALDARQGKALNDNLNNYYLRSYTGNGGNSNFNSIIAPGIYGISYSTIITMTNAPAALGGILSVFTASGYTWQKFIIANTGIEYTRSYNGTSWTLWIRDVGTAAAWTPTIYGSTTQGTPTYASQIGSYYQIGNLCFITAIISISAKGGMAGNIYLSLPFNTDSSIRASLDIGYIAGASYSTYKQIIGAFNQGTNYANLYFVADNATPVFIQAANISDSFAIRFSGCYVIQ